MRGEDKTKEQLLDELANLCARIAELKKSEYKRKQVGEQLRANENKFQSIFNAAANLIILVNKERIVIECNRRIKKVLGYTKKEIIGQSMVKIIHPDYLEKSHACLKETSRKGYSYNNEYKMVRKDGTLIDVSVNSAQLVNKVTEGIFAICLIEDITERKRAEEALKNSLADWQSTFDSMKDSVSLINLEGRFLRCNVALEKLLGKPANEIIGSLCWKLIHGESESIEGCPVVRMKETHQRENKILQLDDRWIEVIVDPQFDDDEKLIGAVHIISDITERKRVEKELINSREKLRNLAVHIQSAREEERTKIAHEIHDEMAQPLAALKMDLFSLSKIIPKDQKSSSKKIESMSKITDDIIKLAKEIYTELRPSLLDELGLPATIEWEAEELQKRTGIRCEVSIDPKTPALDKVRSTAIFRIFEEILTNIMRHAKATKVKVCLRKKGGKLELNVRDNGKGITRKQLTDPKSFGLVEIRERAKSLGGEDKIRGVPGKGTTVTIRIPLKTVGQELE